MSRKTPIIAYVGQDQAVARSVESLKTVVEQLTGVRGGELTSLATGATLAQVVVKVNEIIDRLNQT